MPLLDDLLSDSDDPVKPAMIPAAPGLSGREEAARVSSLLQGIAKLGSANLTVGMPEPATDATLPGFSLSKSTAGTSSSLLQKPRTVISEPDSEQQQVSVDDVNGVAKRISTLEQNLIYSEGSGYNIPNPTDSPPGRPYM